MNIGDTFKQNFLIDQAIFDDFIELFHDRNPLHVDSKYAKNKKFNGKIMHGNILFGFLSYMIGECLPVKNVIILGENITFSQPVYINDQLVLKATIVDVHKSVGVFLFHFEFTNQQQRKVASGSISIKSI